MLINSIFVTNLVNVGKKLETKLQYIDTYLHNKNVLEYGLLLVGSGRFMIFHIEGHSTEYASLRKKVEILQFYKKHTQNFQVY